MVPFVLNLTFGHQDGRGSFARVPYFFLLKGISEVVGFFPYGRQIEPDSFLGKSVIFKTIQLRMVAVASCFSSEYFLR